MPARRKRPVLLIFLTLLIPLFLYGGPKNVEAQPALDPDVRFLDLMLEAGAKAWRSGTAGMMAGALQVMTFMWMRTLMNYQYKFGGSITEAFNALWSQGGISRFYQGVQWALIQNPLCRAGDTGFNTGVLLVCAHYLNFLPIFMHTMLAAVFCSLWRILLTPIDTIKTSIQVNGSAGMTLLHKRVRSDGIMALYAGTLATFAANWVGVFPWFVTMNVLQSVVPLTDHQGLAIVRHGVLGCIASSVSDCCSNSLRVIKTVRQTSSEELSYTRCLQEVIAKDGISGIFFRGLKTRMLINVIQSAFFTILWKLLE